MPDLTPQASFEQAFPTFLVGQRLSLRSLELSDIDALWHWFADRDVVRYSLSLW